MKTMKTLTPLRLMMKIVDCIKDDEQFCEEENNTIYCYLDLKGLLNITDGKSTK